MKLIGQFDSPFVRRVGIALRFYSIPFEHVPWSVFRDAELIARYNPLRRVPTLVLDDGRVLTETLVCLEFIDDLAATSRGFSPDELLLPRSGPQRIEGLRLCALAGGAADKAVSLAYEREIRESQSKTWIDRCTKQVRECLQWLEQERSRCKTGFLLGERISHADIALTCTYTFINSAHPGFAALSLNCLAADSKSSRGWFVRHSQSGQGGVLLCRGSRTRAAALRSCTASLFSASLRCDDFPSTSHSSATTRVDLCRVDIGRI